MCYTKLVFICIQVHAKYLHIILLYSFSHFGYGVFVQYTCLLYAAALADLLDLLIVIIS